jgi:hypothetical protein
MCFTIEMSYQTIQPPFTLKFREMSKKELKDYYKWYHDVMPQRIEMLANAIKDTSGYEHWKADYTPASLSRLGKWLAGQVEKRPRTTSEVNEISTRSPYPIDISDWELTNRTFSLAIDVGMYFSHVLLHNFPSLRWEQPFGNKKFIDYGQPVLTGFGPMFFNPVQILVTLAYGLAKNKHKGERLAELYDVWAKMVK